MKNKMPDRLVADGLRQKGVAPGRLFRRFQAHSGQNRNTEHKTGRQQHQTAHGHAQQSFHSFSSPDCASSGLTLLTTAARRPSARRTSISRPEPSAPPNAGCRPVPCAPRRNPDATEPTDHWLPVPIPGFPDGGSGFPARRRSLFANDFPPGPAYVPHRSDGAAGPLPRCMQQGKMRLAHIQFLRGQRGPAGQFQAFPGAALVREPLPGSALQSQGKARHLLGQAGLMARGRKPAQAFSRSRNNNSACSRRPAVARRKAANASSRRCQSSARKGQSSCAVWEGVAARRSATKSEMVTSGSWPTADMTGSSLS